MLLSLLVADTMRRRRRRPMPAGDVAVTDVDDHDPIDHAPPATVVLVAQFRLSTEPDDPKR